MLYLGNYEYLLASCFSEGSSSLWVYGGTRAEICKRCYRNEPVTELIGPFYILLTQSSWLSQDFFAFLYRKGLDFIKEEGFDVVYFGSAKTLGDFSNRNIEKQNIKEYSHWNCFY